MINEWELDLDLDELEAGLNETFSPTKTEPPAPPAPAVEVVSASPAQDLIEEKADTTPVVITEKDKKKSDLKAIEERWTKRLNQAAAARDAVDQDADPQLWEWENHVWAQDQMQYVNEWNERAGDEADFEWEKNAKAILEDVVADYTRKYGMTAPQTAPTDTGAPEAEAEAKPPEKEQMIRTAITGPKKGRLKGLKMEKASGEPMTIERAAELRSQETKELDADIKATQGQIAELDAQIAKARDAGDQERVDDHTNARHKLQSQLDPMLKKRQGFEAAFRREQLKEQEGRLIEHRTGPFLATPLSPEAVGLAADIADAGLELAGGEDLDPTLDEQAAAARQGLTTMSPGSAGYRTGRTTGRKFAPLLPAEIVLGREAGGVTVYRHADTGEEVRINPDDFAKSGNEQYLADLMAGKFERVGFEKVEKPGEAYTDVDEKVVLSAVRVQHRLNQLNARILQLVGDEESGVPSLIAQEQARLKELQEEQRRERSIAMSAGPDVSRDEIPPALHEASPGTTRDIQDLQRELVNLRDLKQRLSQIHKVTLGGYNPTQAQMEKYIGTFKDEPLPGSVGASKQAKEKLRAMSEQE